MDFAALQGTRLMTVMCMARFIARAVRLSLQSGEDKEEQEHAYLLL